MMVDFGNICGDKVQSLAVLQHFRCEERVASSVMEIVVARSAIYFDPYRRARNPRNSMPRNYF